MPVETLAQETDELQKVWYCSHREKCLGPFTFDGLKHGLQNGDFSKDDLFWREGQAGWLPLKDIPLLLPLQDTVRLPTQPSPPEPGDKHNIVPGRAHKPAGSPKANEKYVTKALTASSLSKAKKHSSYIDLFLAVLAAGGLSSPFWQKKPVDIEAKAKELSISKQSQLFAQGNSEKPIDLLTLTSTAFPKPELNFWDLSCDKKAIRKIAGDKKKAISVDDNSENTLKARYVHILTSGAAVLGTRKNAPTSDLPLGLSLNSCIDKNNTLKITKCI